MEVVDSPSPTDPSGKDSRGRFVSGNRLGKGNPIARRQAEIKRLWLAEITPLTVKAAHKAVFDAMVDGDMAAARLWYEYAKGKPSSTAEADDISAAQGPMVIAPPDPLTGNG